MPSLSMNACAQKPATTIPGRVRPGNGPRLDPTGSPPDKPIRHGPDLLATLRDSWPNHYMSDV
jgi:hypothetical protein